MPDAIQPVGAMIQPPDPMRGINTLSGIIGLQQQRQQLQTGQYLQQTAAAAAAANQQNTKEKMGLAKLLQDPKGNGILDDNNQPTPNAQAIIMGVAPTTGAEHYDNIVKAAQSKVQYNTSVNNLNASERAEIGNAMLARLYDPDAKPADVTGALDAVLAAKTGTPVEDDYRRIIGTQKQILNHTAGQPSGQIAPPGQEAWRRSGIALATALNPQLAKPDVSGMDVGGAVQPGARSPFTGAFTPAGAPIGKSLAPQVVSPPGGPPFAVGGVNGRGGNGPLVQQYPGPQPTDQDMANFQNYQSNLNSRVRSGTNVIAQINQMDQALSSFNNKGGGTKVRAEIAQKLQAIGAPGTVVDAVARGNLGEVQAAEKYLFQSTLDTLQQGGAGVTDQRFASAAAALPSIDTDPRAKASLMGFIRDRAQRDYAEQQALNQARVNGTFNPATWEASYQQRLRANQVPGTPASQVPTAAPQERRSKSKSGKPIVFRNGQWEYE